MTRKRAALTALAVATTGVAAATLLARGTPVRTLPGLAAAVFSPYAAALSPLGVALAVAGRRRIMAAATALVAVAGVAVQVTWYFKPGSPEPVPHSVLRVLTANIRNGEADAASLAGLADGSADVLVVVELTPEALQRLSATNLGRVFPHSSLRPAPLAGGIGIWSRFPLVPLPVPEHPAVTAPAVLLTVPGAAADAVMVAVHVKSPLAEGRNTVGDWDTGLAHLGSQLDRFAATAGAGAVIAAGDFNATPDVRQFRDLLESGYRDAVEQLGAGFSPTFPSDRWYPPLVTIDHVLTRNAAALSVRTVEIPGSDHRGVLARIAVPGGAVDGR